MDKLALQSSNTVISVGPSTPELTLREIWMMLWRRRIIIYSSVAVFLLLAILALMVSTRRYKSVGEIQVQKDSISSLGLQTAGADAPSDALEENMVLQTQAKILASDSLALRVINELHLEQTDDYKEKWSPISWVFGLLSQKGKPDPKGATLENSPHRRMRVLTTFHSKVTVKVVDGTRLIDVEYLSPDPQLAAAVVNHMLQALIESGFQARYDATTQASTWLNEQLGDLRAQTQELQSKVVKLRQDSGVFALGEVDREGKDQVYSPTLDKLQMATQAMSQAKSNRILKGAIYDVVKTGDPEMISGLSGNTILASSSSGIGSSLTLIQNLRLQEANLQGQLDELSAKFGASYPKLSELRGNLNAVKGAIHAEVGRVAERARNDFVVAEQTELNTRKDFEADRSQAEMLNNKTIEYQMVKQEAEQSRSLYDDLLRHLKESGLLAGLRSTNISIVDPGRAADKPAKPVTLLYLIGAIAGGLFFGAAAALLRDVTDAKIQDVREISRGLGEMPLCVLPYQKEYSGLPAKSNPVANSPIVRLPTLDSPRSIFVESLRSLRTSLLLSRSGSPPRLIMVTSPLAGEGKSFISWNLAILFAQQGKRVLLCDADLRRPRLHRDLQINVETGLSTVLTGLSDDYGASAVIPVPEVPGFYLMPAGPIPPYPAELLSSDMMAILLKGWESQYDLVLLDTAPVLPVTDSVVLSSFVDSVLLIARHQKTPLSALERSYQMLESVPSERNRKINVLVNGVREQPAAGHVFYEYLGKESVRT
ncbi:polysaccharide biosynthesis tyrosine autokinase [Granulicella sp. dw_53]|uniref:GumC family protein n=1 Tax=Granulicella sp. dw_53 TaxID=2719792 RepID=UPI001BD4DBCA|nr:polysaccharide biosynthesis tyrosine autokinase [Granulicella sp. dw_53]